MDKLEKAKRLKDMLSQIAGTRGLELIAPAGVKAEQSGAFESLGVERQRPDTVHSGLEKLADNRHQDITPDEMFGLEAIVLRQNRPVVFVRGNSYDDVDEPWSRLNGAEVKTRLSALFPLIGRVELPNSPILPYAGTGFVVGKGLVATNRHVAQIFSRGLGLTIQYRGGDAAIDFKRQEDTPQDDRSAYFAVRGVEMIHPYWDMALLRVDGLPTYKMLRLSVRSPEELVNRNIVAVGYPARDDRSDLALQDKIFGGVYYVKRLQPGVVRVRAQVQSFENRVNAITHDASTLGGNSGSAIIDVDSGEVVALHFAGEYLKANYAVPMFELARDPRVAPKLNFDGTVAATSDFDPAWRSINAEAAGAPAPATPPPPQPSVPLQSPKAPTADDGETTWIVPLRVTVSVGTPTRPAGIVRTRGGRRSSGCGGAGRGGRGCRRQSGLQRSARIRSELPGQPQSAPAGHQRRDAAGHCDGSARRAQERRPLRTRLLPLQRLHE